jgi:hypothetical protein
METPFPVPQSRCARFWLDRFRFLKKITNGRIAIAHRGSMPRRVEVSDEPTNPAQAKE